MLGVRENEGEEERLRRRREGEIEKWRREKGQRDNYVELDKKVRINWKVNRKGSRKGERN